MNMYAYQQYKEQSIHTMTQGELLMLLLDELVKRIMSAELLLKKKDFSMFENSVDRSVEIIRYLNKTLDRKYEISGEIGRMYEFFLYELARVKAGRDERVIAELKPIVEDLRNTFRQVSKQVNV